MSKASPAQIEQMRATHTMQDRAKQVREHDRKQHRLRTRPLSVVVQHDGRGDCHVEGSCAWAVLRMYEAADNSNEGPRSCAGHSRVVEHSAYAMAHIITSKQQTAAAFAPRHVHQITCTHGACNHIVHVLNISTWVTV